MRRSGDDPAQRLPQARLQGLDAGAVGGEVDGDPAREDAPVAQLLDGRVQRGRRARQHGRARPVGGGDVQRAVVRPRHLARLAQVELDERQAAVAGELGEQPAALTDQQRGVLDAQRPAHVRGRDLAHAVPDDGVGHDAPHRAPGVGQRHLEGEQRGLDLAGPLRGQPVLVAPQRTAEMALEGVLQRSIASRKAGTVAASRRPMPSHCDPWPPKTKQVRTGRRAAVRGPHSHWACSPRANAPAPAASSCTSAATIAARCRWWSVRSAAAAASAAKSSPACPASASARRARAGAERAESGTRRGHEPDGSGRSGAGAPATTRCELVPPNPNELTPPSRRTPGSPHGSSRSWTVTGSRSSRSMGLGDSKWTVGAAPRGGARARA